MRKIGLGLLSVAISLLVTLLLLELGFRFLPVHGGAFLEPVNEDAPYAHMVPNSDAQYSVGAVMARAQAHRTNNAGFVSTVDFERTDTPLLAVIGDSYVEALMVPSGAAIQDVLRADLAPGRRVYGIGISGAAPPQYLMWARQAVREFGADRVLFVIVSTDFDESLAKYRSRAGFHYLEGDTEQCALAMRRLDHQPTPFRPLVRHSAVARYLIFNLAILERPVLKGLVETILSRTKPVQEAVGAAPDADTPTDRGGDTANGDDRIRDSKCAATWLLQNAPDIVGLTVERMTFMVDGGRIFGQGVDTPAAGSFFSVMRRHFISEAQRLGYSVIDLEPAFESARAAGQGPFSPPRDSHWNADAHALAAEVYLRNRPKP